MAGACGWYAEDPSSHMAMWPVMKEKTAEEEGAGSEMDLKTHKKSSGAIGWCCMALDSIWGHQVYFLHRGRSIFLWHRGQGAAECGKLAHREVCARVDGECQGKQPGTRG